ncbi:Hydroxyacylglutathione hydrolase [Sinobacterium norvegicum]|uniref:Hydroxyacylglutathione hydrolase n=2 Tax=Sinobacterium norvegicum TaxID=1641715 RepID=A0ABM9ABC3_9GAMM|nr:Hydroxyacylglutathione hydrolase [Sinobacterium norvegicum]
MREITAPFQTPPVPGHVIEVAEGVLWCRMPLPLALDHINVYLIDIGTGWLIVDTGMKGDKTQTLWLQIIEQHLGGRPVVAVLCTHMHPDHIGQAGWLVNQFKVPFYMSQGEYLHARTFTATERGKPTSWRTQDYFSQAGLSEQQVTAITAGFGGFSKLVEPIPSNYIRLRDGQTFDWGKHQWQVVVGRGHSPEHACLYCPALNILLAGDQVIEGISSNVSVLAIEPDAEPLADWLASIERFKLLPDDLLILPAHRLPFYGLHRRLEQLAEHHEEHLQALLVACQQPHTAVELLPVLFKRDITSAVMTLALGECLAHLHELLSRGQLRRDLVAGVHQFTATVVAEADKGYQPGEQLTV